MSILCVMCVGGCSEPCEVGLQSASVLLISLVIGRDGSRLEFHTNFDQFGIKAQY